MRWTKRRVGGGFCVDSASAVSNETKCNSRKDTGKEFGAFRSTILYIAKKKRHKIALKGAPKYPKE